MLSNGSATQLWGEAVSSVRGDPDPSSRLRELARTGRLAGVVSIAPPAERAVLSGAAYAVAWPVVFTRLTRSVELRRGHVACATSLHMMAEDCLDRFHDDVEAVVDDLLSHATKPIQNLEAWIASRLTAATVDGHRRRRGQRGALQRPRIPVWLAEIIGSDPWLTELAVQVLIWVGVPTTAGAGLWPLDSWSQRRALATGDWIGSEPSVVERDLAVVLAAMRTRPKWYADHVERPMGHKRAPLASRSSVSGERPAEPDTLSLTDEDEADDAHLVRLAAAAVDAIGARLHRGEDPRRVVVDVIGTVFGDLHCDRDIDRPPHTGSGYDERLDVLLRDRDEVDRIVAEVLQVVQAGIGGSLRPV